MTPNRRGTDKPLIFAGVPGDLFAARMAEQMGTELAPAKYLRFSGVVKGGEEAKPEVMVNVHDRVTVVVWSPANLNDELVQVLLLIEALKESEAQKVVLVVPYYPYARQDKAHGRREPISAKVVAKLLEAVDLDSIIYFDIHADQIQGFFRTVKVRGLWFDEPYMHYLTMRLAELMAYFQIQNGKIKSLTPDEGAVYANYRIARKMLHGLAVHLKKRNWDSVHSVESMGIAGLVRGCLLWCRDDIVASGDSLFAAAEQAKKKGAKYVMAVASHALGFNKEASWPFVRKLNNSPLDELIVTNSVAVFADRVAKTPGLRRKISVLDISPYACIALKRYLLGETVRGMMKEVNDGDLYRELIVSDQAQMIRDSLAAR
jgi:ribose-phosphate pyrophosphokinase